MSFGSIGERSLEYGCKVLNWC